MHLSVAEQLVTFFPDNTSRAVEKTRGQLLRRTQIWGTIDDIISRQSLRTGGAFLLR